MVPNGELLSSGKSGHFIIGPRVPITAVYYLHCIITRNYLSGLVRGVDMKEKLFYITTPEPQHRLEQVNCLMLGKNELPSSICACSKVSVRLCVNTR